MQRWVADGVRILQVRTCCRYDAAGEVGESLQVGSQSTKGGASVLFPPHATSSRFRLMSVLAFRVAQVYDILTTLEGEKDPKYKESLFNGMV